MTREKAKHSYRLKWWIAAIGVLVTVGLLADGAWSRRHEQPAFTLTVSTLVSTTAHLMSYIELREGRLASKPDLLPTVQAKLQPFDIIIISAPFKGTSFFTPGDATHSSLWLGTKEEWQQNGWHLNTHLKPLYDQIEAGNNLLQADRDGVNMAALNSILNADSINIFRLTKRDDAQQLLTRILSHMGKPYDYNLHGANPNSMLCTELVSSIFPQLGPSQTRIFDRTFITPDDLVATLTASPDSSHIYYLDQDKQIDNSALAPTKRDIKKNVHTGS